jgi:hypothetical protein
VFEQEQHVSDAAFLPEFHEALLQAESGRVINEAELDDGNHE